MMHQATLAVARAMEAHDLKYKTDEAEHISYVETGFSGDNIKHVTIRFLSTDEDNDVAVRVFQVVSVPAEKRSKILPVMNELNRKFRYAKLVMNDDGDISAQYDLPLAEQNVGEACFEILARFVKILDEAYPMLMQALWS